MTATPKILLLLPPANLYPMGAAYVAATLENAGYSYDIYAFLYDDRAWFRNIHVTTDKISHQGPLRNISSLSSRDSLFELIARENYAYILVGGLVGFFRWFYHILPHIKGYSPNATIILGGGITKDLPENTLFDKLGVDYLLKGEAETNLVALLTLLSQRNPNPRDYFEVPGLCWKDRASAIRQSTPVRFDLTQHVTRPAWDSFNIPEYITLSDTLFHFNKTFFPILAGRGCPNVCAFCSPSIGHFTSIPVDRVISEMKHWVAKYEFDFFFIYSEVAFDDEDYAQEFCRVYKQEINKPWVGQLRTDVHFSVDTYRQIKQAGCMFMSLGFESSNDRVLKIMNKRTTCRDHMRNLTQAKEAGLTVVGNFMFGHETETAEEIRETFAFLNEHDLINGSANGLATIIVYPGTRYYRRAEQLGLVHDPFQYLLSYSMKAAISSVNIRDPANPPRLNISALSTDDFYAVVCTEYIAHRRLYSQQHAAVDVETAFTFGAPAGYLFKGTCPTCGHPVHFPLEAYANPLRITTLCDGCYYAVSVDIFSLPDTRHHLQLLRKRIDNSHRIVVYGKWIMDLLYCGSLSIPCEKLIAWIDPEAPAASQSAHFYHLPQLSLADLPHHDYDAILSLRPRALSTPQVIEEHGLNPRKQIIHLFPDDLNAAVASTITGKRVAIAGVSESAMKAHEFLDAHRSAAALSCVTTISDFRNRVADYDYIIYDNHEFAVTRQEFAERSSYHIDQVLYTAFLLDGGYYVRY